VKGKAKINRLSFQRWRALRIPAKFGLASGLLLLIILTQTVIAYTALTIVWEANHSIQSGVEAQRLVMGMSRNWETARRLQTAFFFESPDLGADKAYELYALPASEKIAEVVRDGATLRRLLSSSDDYEHLREYDPTVRKFLATVSEYATTFEEATDLELQLASNKTGLLSQLESTAAELLLTLQANDQCNGLLSNYYQMLLFGKNYQGSTKSISGDGILDATARLRRIIEACPMQAGQRTSALAALDEYESTANRIFSIDGQIQKNLDQVDALGESIDPNLVGLLVAVDAEVKRGNQQIEQTRRTAVTMLVTAAIIGLLSTVIIAVILHKSVTQNIVKLTRVAGQFHEGNLNARAPVNSSDELGDLSTAFNGMADALVHRLNEIEDLQATLREQAIRDSLTGLFNRRYLDETLPRELARASREETHLSLVIMDIDHFKEINDRYGHAVGDRMLAEFGRLMQSKSRSSDVACRYGGDEFVVLLLGTRLEEAIRRVEDWQRGFSNIVVPFNDTTVHTTISAGIGEWVPGETSTELLIRADAALYGAKNTGRNRISVKV
jgi:diguanylate cyclase (GGDEF)-like protein